jgi:hypothetical protein
MQRYIRAAAHAADYASVRVYRDHVNAEIEAMRKALPALSEDEALFVDILEENPLLTIGDAAELAGFSATMATTLCQDERILKRLRFHAATTRLVKILREVARKRPDLIDDRSI